MPSRGHCKLQQGRVVSYKTYNSSWHLLFGSWDFGNSSWEHFEGTHKETTHQSNKEGLFFREEMAYPGMSPLQFQEEYQISYSAWVGGVIMKGIDGQLAERSRSFQTPLRKVSFRQCRGSLVVIGPTAILSTINVPEVQGTSPRRKIPP